MSDRFVMINDETARQNDDGGYTQESRIKPIDLARDDLVYEIANNAEKIRNALTTFRANTLSEIGAFVDLSAAEYGTELGGKKGNVTLYSFDKRYKIQRAISDYIVFDERLQVAQSLIMECIAGWSEGGHVNIKVLVDDAFQVDREGNVSTARVLGLRRHNFTDEKWLKAMAAIADSMGTNASKTYVRIYERQGDSDEYKAISLNVAAA